MVYSEKVMKVILIEPYDCNRCAILQTRTIILAVPQNKTMNTMGSNMQNTYIDDDVWLAEGNDS